VNVTTLHKNHEESRHVRLRRLCKDCKTGRCDTLRSSQKITKHLLIVSLRVFLFITLWYIDWEPCVRITKHLNMTGLQTLHKNREACGHDRLRDLHKNHKASNAWVSCISNKVHLQSSFLTNLDVLHPFCTILIWRQIFDDLIRI